MRDDSILDEIHRFREEYAKRFNYDLNAICQDLREQQQKSGHKIVSFPPRRPEGWSEPQNCESSSEPSKTPPLNGKSTT